MYEFLSTALSSGLTRIHFTTYKRALMNAIADADGAVRFATYVTSFSLKKPGNPVYRLIDLLDQKRKERVEISVILDGPKKNRSNYIPAKDFIQFLGSKKFNYVVNWGRPTLHMKLFIIDLETAFIGSHNPTRQSLENPLDCSVEINDPYLVRELAHCYDLLFGSLKDGKG